MDKKELLKLLINVPEEDQTTEFKRLGGENAVRKIVETIVAMANAEGGTIVLGVDDPEKTDKKGLDRLFGIEESKENFDAIGREIQKVIPPLSGIWPPQIIFIEEIKKSIALVFIPKCNDDFRHFNNKVILRQQKSNIELNPHEVVTFSYAKGFKRADIELVKVDFSLLDTSYYHEWKNSRKILETDIKDVLEKTGLARKDDQNYLLPTRAAVLLFAEYPTNLMDTKCTIRIFQYSGKIEKIGNTPNLVSVPETMHGPIIKIINDAQEFVLRLLRAGITIPHSGFINKYKIPERAIKEAITNAVIHRDYFLKRDIEIKVFEDRIEIENPGLLPFNITASNIGKVRADGYRNDLLVKILREYSNRPNLDQNEGVRAMRAEMKAQNLYPPIFITYPHLKDSVRVVLINEFVATEWQKISDYLEKNKYIANAEARKITGTEQRDKMTQIFKKWVEQGLIVQIKPQSGYVKETKYRLPNNNEIETRKFTR
ncbi:MAG: putative DNA binding domain-containing protein [Candidatus Parcubacteria bacterium]|nr:putative DNA binding domain-containing protein [Candidatus Parcubacteria bacterium]